MSYKTNPILNRLGISVGWLTPFYPSTRWKYSLKVHKWLELYLLLKEHLARYEMRVLTFCFKAHYIQTKNLVQKKNLKNFFPYLPYKRNLFNIVSVSVYNMMKKPIYAYWKHLADLVWEEVYYKKVFFLYKKLEKGSKDRFKSELRLPKYKKLDKNYKDLVRFNLPWDNFITRSESYLEFSYSELENLPINLEQFHTKFLTYLNQPIKIKKKRYSFLNKNLKLLKVKKKPKIITRQAKQQKLQKKFLKILKSLKIKKKKFKFYKKLNKKPIRKQPKKLFYNLSKFYKKFYNSNTSKMNIILYKRLYDINESLILKNKYFISEKALNIYNFFKNKKNFFTKKFSNIKTFVRKFVINSIFLIKKVFLKRQLINKEKKKQQKYPYRININMLSYHFLINLTSFRRYLRDFLNENYFKAYWINLKWPIFNVSEEHFEVFNFSFFRFLVGRFYKQRHFQNSIRVLYLFEEYQKPSIFSEHIAYELTKKKKHTPILRSLQNMMDIKEIFSSNFGIIRTGIFGKVNGKRRARHYYFQYGPLPKLQTFFDEVHYHLAHSLARTGVFGIRIWTQMAK